VLYENGESSGPSIRVVVVVIQSVLELVVSMLSDSCRKYSTPTGPMKCWKPLASAVRTSDAGVEGYYQCPTMVLDLGEGFAPRKGVLMVEGAAFVR